MMFGTTHSHVDEAIKWLQLIRSPNIGPKRFWGLLQQFENMDTALQQLKEVCPLAHAQGEYKTHEKKGLSVLCAFDSDFPSLLRPLPDCPPLISVAGNCSVLKTPIVSIVGARNASLVGKKIAFQLAKGLGEMGWTIASGMARGIDASAHQGALPNQSIAVLAGGVDVIYPNENEKLYEELVQKGAVISEMPLGTNPTASLFPRRNRIISALSQLVIVVEAAYSSGSMITAQCALEQGKDVCAVPGSPLDPRNRGSHLLIKQGAALVETVDDVLNLLGHLPKNKPISEKREEDKPPPISPDLDNLKALLLEDLCHVPTAIDTLLTRYGCPAPILLALISELELDNTIRRVDGHFLIKTV
jgi:DNA processing protein